MLTLKQLNHSTQDKFPSKPQFTDQALSKAFEARMITFKIARDCPAEGNTYDMESRRSYALWIFSPAIINMRKNFIDEFGINVHLRQSQDRSARRDRVYRVVCQKGSNVLFVAQYRLMEAYYIIKLSKAGGMEKELFAIFLQVLCGNLILNEGPDGEDVCIFDNATGHAKVEEMDLNGIFQLRRLPKYSPFLTMVENAISCWKAAMKRIMQEEMDSFINADRLRAPGVTLQQIRFNHLKSIADRTNG